MNENKKLTIEQSLPPEEIEIDQMILSDSEDETIEDRGRSFEDSDCDEYEDENGKFAMLSFSSLFNY